MQEKYGFVYIWRDRKHKRFYIGCHWGREDDGYVCSSPWMKQGYKHRPKDFKRRVLSRVYTNRTDLLEVEYRWLSMIKSDELKIRYYNLNNHHHGHWASDDTDRKTIGQKISAAMANPKIKAKLREYKLGDKNPMKRQDVVEKRLQTWRENNKNYTPWNYGKVLGPNPMHSERMKGRVPHNKGISLTDDQKNKISKRWKITHPDGKIEIILNLNKFCNDMGLCAQNLRTVAYGKRSHSGGYRCEVISGI